jgi:hypothetical protein
MIILDIPQQHEQQSARPTAARRLVSRRRLFLSTRNIIIIAPYWGRGVATRPTSEMEALLEE